MDTLTRTTFTTSRLLEFFTEKELAMQIGQPKHRWPIALVKELIDNALDAAEMAGEPPAITVHLEPDAVSVCDNGLGLPAATLERSLDYAVRVSDKSYYASPTRGQLGNALKCVWAAPFVVNGRHGRVDVATGGTLYQIDVTLDMIAQQPKIDVGTGESLVKNGTNVTVHWPGVASLLDASHNGTFYNGTVALELVQHYAALNPHVSFTFCGPDGFQRAYPASDTSWRKWAPNAATSPHWYTLDALRALIAAYVSAERDGSDALTARAFVSQFAGLSGTAKQKHVTEAAGLAGAYLHDLVDNDRIDAEPTTRLLLAMRDASRPVKPAALGSIGESHLTTWLERHYCERSSVQYRKATGEAAGLPFVLETAMGIYQAKYSDYDAEAEAEIVTGLNWAPTLDIPMAELGRLLGENRVDRWDPLALVVHLACPRLEFTDRGKSRLALPDEILDALEKTVKAVTKAWKREKRQADREGRIAQQKLDAMRKLQRRQELSIKDAAYEVMEEAYLKASNAGQYPANARQVMYAARPLVLELTGGKCWKKSSYFTQVLLPGFLKRYPKKTADWDVVYDDRGKLMEPHTGVKVPLGTLAVRQYVAHWTGEKDGIDSEPIILPGSVETTGPVNRYKYALFVEKEGFNPLWETVKLADRYDLAIMSTKGMSVTAARLMVEELARRQVTILVLRDFDKAGFSIVGTLRGDTWRWRYQVKPNVIDLGVRLVDVQELGLQSEPVYYASKRDPRENLEGHGATWEECSYLVKGGRPGRWHGARVEINAMTSAELVSWLEGKLQALGTTRVIPAGEVLETAYHRAYRLAVLQAAIDQAERELSKDTVQPGAPLGALVAEGMKETGRAWDDVLFDIATKAYRKASRNGAGNGE